jgi:putative flippase GtrA
LSERWRTILWRWLKFNFVGGVGIAVQLTVLAVLKLGLHFHYLLATGLAVEIAVLHNFLWHERFTWSDRVQIHWKESLERLLRFNLTNGAISIVGNLALMSMLVGKFRMNYLVANMIAIAICSLANFLASELYVFRARRKTADNEPEHGIPAQPIER